MRGLLLAEKPSVMVAIREVYKKERSFPHQLEFGAFHGHLMELKTPGEYEPAWEDRSNAANLPMIPSNFSYKPNDEKSVGDLCRKITSGHFDFLINACDAGREGEHIFWSFYETMGLTLPVKRFWASSVTAPALIKALYDLKEASLYNGLRQASKFRAQFDWLVGMNFTRAATIAMNRFASIGRVQSPTLKLIVDREKEIQSFVAQDFYEVKGRFSIGTGEGEFLYLIPPDRKTSRFQRKIEADAIAEAVKRVGDGTVVGVKEALRTVDAPTLYSLTELQKDANRHLKFSADRTLEIAQALYEGGYLTYPRTESRFLPTDMIPEIRQHIAPLQAVPELASIASGISQVEIDEMLKKNYVNDAGITDHHAIIPTDQIPNFGSLSKDEAALYTLVGKSFLAIFMPPYQVAMTTILVAVGQHIFRAQGRREVNKGYSILYPAAEGKGDILLPACKKGDMAALVKTVVSKGTTKPPPRLTPRTLLSLMVNAGQDLPDSTMRSILKESAGLGTPATRAEILKKLESRGYVELRSNSYYALPKGIDLIDAIGDRTFCSALLTAQWEEKLSNVERGTYQGDFYREMECYIREETAYLLENVKSLSVSVGICPVCGGNIIKSARGYICENRKRDDPNSCTFWLPQTVGGVAITEETLAVLLSGRQTDAITLMTKSGRKLRTRLYLDRKTYELKLDLQREEVGLCPLCRRPVYSGSNSFFCNGTTDNSCNWSISRVIKGTELGDADVAALLGNKQTRVMTFTWRNGERGKARLSLARGALQWSFVD